MDNGRLGSAPSRGPSASTPPLIAARAPARQGAPPSNRNFNLSSAGGATGVAARGGAGGQGNAPRFGPGKGAATLSVAQKNKQAAWGESYTAAEETVRNDYSTHYVRTGERPQNHLRGAELEARFEEYPKLASLLTQKHTLTSDPSNSIPPTYLPTHAKSMPEVLPSLFAHRFDVILLSPPADTPFGELQALELSRLASAPGFVWLWVGSGVRGDGIGLEKGRELLASWGYRRSEDIVWLKTNKNAPETDLGAESSTLFTPTIEHCLMGIRGTVRRSTDPWFVHCNVDTDVLVWEGDDEDPLLKPPELQALVENFCLGTRRLHLYGSPHSLRRGWLTVGADFDAEKELVVKPVAGEEDNSDWKPRLYEREAFERVWSGSGKRATVGEREGEALREGDEHEQVASLLPFVQELDNLRPKSPPPRNGLPSSGGLGRGRGAGLGITRSSAAGAASQASGAGRGRGRGGGGAAGFGGLPFQQQHQHQHRQQQYHHAQQYQHPSLHPFQQPPQPAFYQQQPSFAQPPFDYQQQQHFLALQQQQMILLQQQQQAVYEQWMAMGGGGGMGVGMGFSAEMNGVGVQQSAAQNYYPIGGPGAYSSQWQGQGNAQGQMEDAQAEVYGFGGGGGGVGEGAHGR